MALLLSTLEQMIVGTALTNIASDLGDYDKSSWVVTAYLMSYNGACESDGNDISQRKTTDRLIERFPYYVCTC